MPVRPEPGRATQWNTGTGMLRPVEFSERAQEIRARRAVSPLDYSVAVRLAWAGGLAALLWIAVAWALGWLP
jgi:hypothetical protein